MKERKDETKKNHVCRCFRQPLLNALFGAPLAVVTVSSIFEYHITSWAHLCLGSFDYCSLCNTFQAPSGEMGNFGANIFRSLLRCSRTFKFCLELDHIRTLTGP